MTLGDLFNCSANNTQELVACLRQEDAHRLDFWGVVVTILESGNVMNLLPVIDGDFVPRPPIESFEMGVGERGCFESIVESLLYILPYS